MRRFIVFGAGVRLAFEADDAETNNAPASDTNTPENADNAPADNNPADDTQKPNESNEPADPDASTEPKPDDSSTSDTDVPAPTITKVDDNDAVPPVAAPADDAGATPSEPDQMVLPTGVELVVAHNEDRAALEAAVNEVVTVNAEALMFANALRETQNMSGHLETVADVVTPAERALIENRAAAIAETLSIPPVEVVAVSSEDEAALSQYHQKLKSHLDDMTQVLKEAGAFNIECMLRSIYNATEFRPFSAAESEFALRKLARFLRAATEPKKVISPEQYAKLSRLIATPDVKSCLAGDLSAANIFGVEDTANVLRIFTSYLTMSRHVVTAIATGVRQLNVILTSRDEQDLEAIITKATEVFEVAFGQAFNGLPRAEDRTSVVEPIFTSSLYGIMEDASQPPFIKTIITNDAPIATVSEPVTVNVTELSDTFYVIAGVASAFWKEGEGALVTDLKKATEGVISRYSGAEAAEIIKLIQSSPKTNEVFLGYMDRLKNATLFLLGLYAYYVGALNNLSLFAQMIAGVPEEQPAKTDEV